MFQLIDGLPAGVLGVRGVGWIRDACGLFRHGLPGELRVFHVAEEDAARAWIAA